MGDEAVSKHRAEENLPLGVSPRMAFVARAQTLPPGSPPIQLPTASFALGGTEVSQVTKTPFLLLAWDTPLPVWEPLPFPDVEELQG